MLCTVARAHDCLFDVYIIAQCGQPNGIHFHSPAHEINNNNNNNGDDHDNLHKCVSVYNENSEPLELVIFHSRTTKTTTTKANSACVCVFLGFPFLSLSHSGDVIL